MFGRFARKSMLLHLINLGKNQGHVNDFESRQNKLIDERALNKGTKKLLIVGMSESPHLQSWIRGIAESQIVKEVWLFPSDYPVRKLKIPGITIHEFPYVGFGMLTNISFRILDLATGRLWRSYFLHKMINRVKPTLMHFHEIQHGAYLYNPIFLHPKNRFSGKTIVSTWGSDLLFFGKLKSHETNISQVLNWTQTLTSERLDDLEIAEKFGYSGAFYAPIYITLGSKNHASEITDTSSRSTVLVKGHQDTHGRALNALECIRQVLINNPTMQFSARVFSATEPVRQQVEYLRTNYGIDIEVLPRMSKPELQEQFKKARIYLGLSTSDGLSTSMVEAMSNGTFPIQSENSAAPEFLEHGKTGGVVNPWDITEIVKILCLAMEENELVDEAAKTNLETLSRKYNWDIGISHLRKIYE